MKKIISKLMGGVLMFSLTMSLTSCEDVLGHWEKPVTPSDITPTIDEVIKYGFKVTDLAGVDRTEAVTSLKMSKTDGTLVAEAEVSADHKITIKNTDLSAAAITAAADFWFEATINANPYIAKVNIDPTALSPESDKTLAMATVGDVILSDGTFDVSTTAGTKVAMIAYVGSETGEAAYGFNHGLALALSDASTGCKWSTSYTDAGHIKQTSSTFTVESGLQYNATHNTNDYPAFKAAKNYNDAVAPTGCSAWFLASGYQWNQMLGANGYGLANLKTTANGYTGLQPVYYWSSTEYGSNSAWNYRFDSGNWNNGSKGNDVRVRACLAF